MQEKHLYEYAVIRFVPKVEREEFFNIGIIMFSKRARFLNVRYLVDDAKANLFASECDKESALRSLDAFEKVCAGSKDGGTIAQLDIAERFRWLIASRSTCIQVSKAHSGFSADLNKTFDQLFSELVL